MNRLKRWASSLAPVSACAIAFLTAGLLGLSLVACSDSPTDLDGPPEWTGIWQSQADELTWYDITEDEFIILEGPTCTRWTFDILDIDGEIVTMFVRSAVETQTGWELLEMEADMRFELQGGANGSEETLTVTVVDATIIEAPEEHDPEIGSELTMQRDDEVDLNREECEDAVDERLD